jgi:oxygen-dependent protoporphyrinogen oxidase
MKVAVIGGGISGLCTAYHLKKAGTDITLFERSERVGGNLGTAKQDGYLIEYGPNSLLANREILDLIEDLQITREILRPRAGGKKRYIIRDGKLTALPGGPLDIFTTGAFSFGGRLRVLKEPFIKTKSINGESVAAFFDRRLGREITEYAVDPFISGIYAGDPKKLAIKNAFPKLHRYEKEKGSIIKGAFFAPKDKNARLPKNAPRSFTFKDGMTTLTDALQDNLGGDIRLGTSVTSISKEERGYHVLTDDGDELFDTVVISTPARAASCLISSLDGPLAAELADIYYPPIAVIYAGFRRDQIKVNATGFGFLVPAVENRKILGCLFSSSLFEERAPDGFELFTTFIGGSRKAELCNMPDNELIKLAIEELRDILKIDGEAAFASIKKWERSIPQYNIGYERVPATIDKFRETHPGIFFCSNFYNGISVGDCVKNSVTTANQVLKYLSK